MKQYRWILAMMAAFTAGSACSSDPATGDSHAGTLVLRLTTPNADDGALLFQLSGPPIDSAIAVNGSLRLFTRQADDSTMIGALVGVVASGAVVTLRVPEVGAAGRYSARLLEVADRQDALRTTLTGYGLTVGP